MPLGRARGQYQGCCQFWLKFILILLWLEPQNSFKVSALYLVKTFHGALAFALCNHDFHAGRQDEARGQFLGLY